MFGHSIVEELALWFKSSHAEGSPLAYMDVDAVVNVVAEVHLINSGTACRVPTFSYVAWRFGKGKKIVAQVSIPGR